MPLTQKESRTHAAFLVTDEPPRLWPTESEVSAVVEREQATHAVTLALMSHLLDALRVRGANGSWATRFCVLCQHKRPGEQARCLHVQGREHVEREKQRMDE